MRTFTISMRYLPLLFIAACGDNKARLLPDARPDAGPVPDADGGPDCPHAPPTGMSGPLQLLDWRTTRCAPIATSTVTLPTATLFAVSGDGFVTQSDCQNTPGCSLTWRDLAGTAGTQRDHMARLASIAISPDGKQTQLAALDAIESCNDGQGIFQVARGALQLLDLSTGASSFELPLRSNIVGVQGFTPLGDWFFTSPIEGTACSSTTTSYRSTASPFAPAPGLDATDEFVQAVDARRWVVQRSGAALGLTDPLTPGSFQSLSGNDPDPFFNLTQGWVHVYLGFADLVRDVVSVPPTGPMRQTTVIADEDWHSFGARGRWIRVCGLPKPSGAETYRDCRVIDAQGELAPVDFRITFALTRPDDAVLLGSGAVVFVGPTADGSPAVQRLEFATGQSEILHPGDGALRPLGDGAAALLVQNGAAWLIEAKHEELVAENVSQVVSVPKLLALALGRGAGRQDDLTALVSSPSLGQFTLALLDVRTRRLAKVTDNLYFTPLPPGVPFNFGDGCGQPWTTRNGGTVIEGFFQQPQQLFFVEPGTPATLWLIPVDLSAPPRRLAELADDPAFCHAPLASPDGRRFGFAENGADGTTTKITLSSEN